MNARIQPIFSCLVKGNFHRQRLTSLITLRLSETLQNVQFKVKPPLLKNVFEVFGILRSLLYE